MFKTRVFALTVLLVSPVVFADGHGHHKHHKHHHHDHYVEVERVYYPERIVQYVPAPVAVPVSPPVPRYPRYDQRSTSGLVGSAIGSAAGYELSRGDPLGAGIGAAAGAMIGNGMAR